MKLVHLKKYKIAHQLLEGRLVQVGLQGEVAEGFPWRLEGLDLHRIPLHTVVMTDRTACHQRGACQALQILQEEHNKNNEGDKKNHIIIIIIKLCQI